MIALLALTRQFFFVKKRGRTIKVVNFLAKTDIALTAKRFKAYLDKVRADHKEISIKPVTDGMQLVTEVFEE